MSPDGRARLMHDLAPLLSEDSAWPAIEEWIATAENTVSILKPREPQRSEALVSLKLTTHSSLGALVYETGGLLIANGWLRILGSGNPRLPRSLVDWNRNHTWHKQNENPPLLLVADDVVGGLFAINGGAFEGPAGQVYYFAPDTLAWESLEVGYSDFLHWALSGDLSQFYDSFRWPGWIEEVSQLGGDEAFSIYPFPFAKGPAIADRSRKVVPAAELFDLYMDLRRQLVAPQREP